MEGISSFRYSKVKKLREKASLLGVEGNRVEEMATEAGFGFVYNKKQFMKMGTFLTLWTRQIGLNDLNEKFRKQKREDDQAIQ